MTEYGVTSAGFVPKTLDILDAEIDAELKGELGDFINTLPEDVFGQLKGIFAERESNIWELMQDIYDSQYPNSAADVSLDLVAQITGITRQQATKSTVENIYLIGTLGTLIPAGTILSVEGNSLSRFLLDDAVTLVAGADEVQDLTYPSLPESGQFKLELDSIKTSFLDFDATAQEIEDALNALSNTFGDITVSGDMFPAGMTITFAGRDGKQPISLLVITDSNVDVMGSVAETTPGVIQGSTGATAETAGSSFTANARTLTVIETAVTGFDSAFNLADATVGNDVETDTELRARRENALGTNAAGTLPAIRTAVLEIDEVDATFVVENDSDAVVAGRPAHSFETIVEQADGGSSADAEVAEAIFNSKPAGIQPFGNDVTEIVVDSQGFNHTVEFSRPVAVTIYLEVDLETDSDFPPTGTALAAAALLEFGENLGIGKDVIIRPELMASLEDIPGITDIIVRIGTAPAPTLDNNIPIEDGSTGTVEKSDWDSSRITVAELP